LQNPITNSSFNPERPQTSPEIKLTKEYLLALLEESNWNKAEVGRKIQKSRTSVWKYMKKWKIPLTEGYLFYRRRNIKFSHFIKQGLITYL
jgi:biotin operon repressor